MSAFRFSVERPIAVVATNLLPFTPLLGLWAQQVHSPLLKRLGPKSFTHFVSGIVTQVGRRPSARSFLVIFPLYLVTVLEVFNFPSFLLELLVLTKFRLLERRILTSYCRPNEVFSLFCFLQFGESLGTASNKQWDLMMNSGELRITTHIWL